jgi:hypothetical protein
MLKSLKLLLCALFGVLICICSINSYVEYKGGRVVVARQSEVKEYRELFKGNRDYVVIDKRDTVYIITHGSADGYVYFVKSQQYLNPSCFITELRRVYKTQHIVLICCCPYQVHNSLKACGNTDNVEVFNDTSSDTVYTATSLGFIYVFKL